MQHYEKGEVLQLEDVEPLYFEDSCIRMKVSYGSKIKNLMGYAMKKIKEPNIAQISWTGQGKALYKTISCAEIFQNKVKGLHRACNIRYIRTEEYWEPKTEGLERLKVNIDVPIVTILLSKKEYTHDVQSIRTPRELEVLLKKAVKESQSKKALELGDRNARGASQSTRTPGTSNKPRKSSQSNREKSEMVGEKSEPAADRTSGRKPQGKASDSTKHSQQSKSGRTSNYKQKNSSKVTKHDSQQRPVAGEQQPSRDTEKLDSPGYQDVQSHDTQLTLTKDEVSSEQKVTSDNRKHNNSFNRKIRPKQDVRTGDRSIPSCSDVKSEDVAENCQ